MKIYVICQNDEETVIYTPEIFKDEEKALAYLRKEFIDNLALEDLFNIGKRNSRKERTFRRRAGLL